MHTRELLASGHGAPGVCRNAREDGGGQGQPGFLVRLGWVVCGTRGCAGTHTVGGRSGGMRVSSGLDVW